MIFILIAMVTIQEVGLLYLIPLINEFLLIFMLQRNIKFLQLKSK